MNWIEEKILEAQPPKPELEYRERSGPNGETIVELTPDSNVAYGRWLTACTLARQAIYKELNDSNGNNGE